ncbi:hypothetical protein SAMN02745227_01896 [Anaerobranca californiensis DSM 14826]|jgi:predicted RNA-binding protein with PIN domain|uniref:YacP-like NYN domain-containing protein n=1 Tax=Anaerobranca californiensis DSM 14826 TaxID=1120989 RepID=A0A1M6QY85_9FIRM|nr:NYN domain-containing protein [Anaerobranca californiensis]SHK25174.1 hypothetical protein SAMN02745227_01896 [Anaerobranca californiensis DSM 14826]
MKWLNKGITGREVLIIDGYNFLYGYFREKTKERELLELREEIINKLLEYQKFTGEKVILVFDAYRVKGSWKLENVDGLEIIYTKFGQTADALIERLVKEFIEAHIKVTVVTSDYTQQQLVMGKGAIRKSSREFIEDIKDIENKISDKIKKNKNKGDLGNTLSDRIDKNTLKTLKNRFSSKKG